MDAIDKWNLAVGDLVRQATILESTIGIMLHGLLGIPQHRARIALRGNVSGDLTMIKRLIPERVPDESVRTLTLEWVKRANQLFEKRNFVVHSTWIPQEGSYWRVHQRAPTQEAEYMDVAEVRALARSIEQHGQEPISTVLDALSSTVDGPWAVASRTVRPTV